jgi:TonB-dependent SusC/RagA subfamily outer membrane receptor
MVEGLQCLRDRSCSDGAGQLARPVRFPSPSGLAATLMGTYSMRIPNLVWLALSLVTACATGNVNSKPPASGAMTAEDLARNTDEPIERVLQTKYPGIYVTRVNNELVVQIRGPASFYGSSAPLVVIDETPMPAGPGGSLSGLNPYDIESIRVLKNPADIGIYGIRGANGVILITTKHSSKGT